MEKRQLGKTDIQVSKICLGTMTWGDQNDEADAHQQLDYAIDHGVNFIDTAELYAVPPKASTYTLTEGYIGNWLHKTGKRSEVVLASKMAGPGWPWIRDGAGLAVKDIETAIDGSLKRLQTDYIDLYQLHWPMRPVALWGKLNYESSMYDAAAAEQIESFYIALAKFVEQGKVRHLGLSNETAWGVMHYQRIADKHGLPPMASIQNAYSILRRDFEVALGEVALYESVGLLAYSPLAGGVLSGKYRNGQRPANTRFVLFPELMGYYANQRTEKAIEAYTAIAEGLHLSLTQLSLAFVNDLPFVTSNIIGATTMQQLAENIGSADVSLSADTFKQINEVFNNNPNPGSW